MRKQLNYKDIRAFLYMQCNGYCPSCGRKMQNKNPHDRNTYMTIDHIVPQAMGGTSNLENFRPLCRSCNMKRGTDDIAIKFSYTDYQGRNHCYL